MRAWRIRRAVVCELVCIFLFAFVVCGCMKGKMCWEGNGNACFFRALKSAGLASCLDLGGYYKAVQHPI